MDMNVSEFSNISKATITNNKHCSADPSIHHPHWLNHPPLPTATQVTMGVIGGVIFILSFAGNISVMFLFKRFRSLRIYPNLLVLNLTIADFLLCVGNVPAFIIASFYGYWVFGTIGCRVYAFIGSVTSFVSINTLTVIALDRCLVIVKTLPITNRMSARTFFTFIAFTWIYSLVWASAPLLGFGQYVVEGTNTSCTFDFFTRTLNNRLYVISIFLAHFIIPLIIIVSSYSIIYRMISQHTNEFKAAESTYGEQDVPLNIRKCNTGLKYEARTARVSLIVILVFIVSWTPYAIIALIGEFGDRSIVSRLGAGIPCLIAKLSTVVNPILYALLHPMLRQKLVNLGACTVTEHERRISLRRSVIYFRARSPFHTSSL